MSLLLMLWLSVVPKGVILVKGATPSASDATTPVPEQGTVGKGVYRNAYFGLSYPIPAGWSEQPAGPPPSDGGAYTLTAFNSPHVNVLVAAQDLFFRAYANWRGLQPEEVTIAGRAFQRIAYSSPRSGLHWRILSTEVRCHMLTFTFTGNDDAALDAAERAMSGVALAPSGPACVRGYDAVVEKTDPVFSTHRFNTIPVRVIIDEQGRVKHAHLLSAFPEQSEAILAALRTWRFKPYTVHGRAVAVETGIVFGSVIRSVS